MGYFVNYMTHFLNKETNTDRKNKERVKGSKQFKKKKAKLKMAKKSRRLNK